MNRFHSGAVIAFAVLLAGSTSFGQNQASTAPPTNDAIVHHMEELEEQVKELRAEVAALKDNDKPATAATATASVTPHPNTTTHREGPGQQGFDRKVGTLK
jgi:outer membrane murein-binding lipoprotein Lpp